jgi:hypothetical protein
MKNLLVVCIVLILVSLSLVSSVNSISLEKEVETKKLHSCYYGYGYVYDNDGNPIEGARVTQHECERFCVEYSDSNGRYGLCFGGTWCERDLIISKPGYNTYEADTGAYYSQHAIINPTSPDLWVENDIIEFDDIKPGSTVSKDIIIYNAGKEDSYVDLDWKIEFGRICSGYRVRFFDCIKFNRTEGTIFQNDDKTKIKIEIEAPPYKNEDFFAELKIYSKDNPKEDYHRFPVFLRTNDDLDALYIKGDAYSNLGEPIDGVNITIKEIRDDYEEAKEWYCKTNKYGSYDKTVFLPEFEEYSIKASKEGWFEKEQIITYECGEESKTVDFSLLRKSRIKPITNEWLRFFEKWDFPLLSKYTSSEEKIKPSSIGNGDPPKIEIKTPHKKYFTYLGYELFPLPFNTVWAGHAPIPFCVSAEHESGIEKVEFYIENELKHTVESSIESLYRYEWWGEEWIIRGIFDIAVIAYDNNGGIASDETRLLVNMVRLE